jgi:hypothetical protein
MPFERTCTRLWKRLGPESRLSAAQALLTEATPENLGLAVSTIARHRKMRPQAARSLPIPDQTKALATILDPGEALASSLLVALHLGQRRDMLTTFLDAASIRHEGGVIAEDDDGQPLTSAAAESAAAALAARFPAPDVRLYLNTLWLQDPDRWASLESIEASLSPA